MSGVAGTPARCFAVHYCPLPGTRSVGVAITILRQHSRTILLTLSVSQLLGMETFSVIVLHGVLYYMCSRYNWFNIPRPSTRVSVQWELSSFMVDPSLTLLAALCLEYGSFAYLIVSPMVYQSDNTSVTLGLSIDNRILGPYISFIALLRGQNETTMPSETMDHPASAPPASDVQPL